jgi:transient receptor potential cation channel subfamily M member 2
LLNKTSYDSHEVQLNPNHTHFILVDDGSRERFGNEVEFRLKFESHLSKSLKIPKILIVIEGGLGTLKTIFYAVRTQTPVILIAV